MVAQNVERPVIDAKIKEEWGSDLIAKMLQNLDVQYVALNPGSSFRGLHDSLVNYLGNENPQLLLCLHEEHTVAIAHGWAKVTGKPMAVIVHSNVGLMHASMAIYNAWCDRVPILIFGATGPVDANHRRPWIDWIHTSRDQAAIVRPYVKWDDQPASLEASLESMLRSSIIAKTAPKGPVYVAFDVKVQEDQLDGNVIIPSLDRYQLPEPAAPNDVALKRTLNFLDRSKRPVFLMGRVSRENKDWAHRVALAEHFKAKVITDIKVGAAFPTDHSLHVGKPGFFLSPDSAKTIADADLIVSFDWVDLSGTLKQAGQLGSNAKIIQVSIDHHIHNGWSLDHQALAPADLHLASEPDTAIGLLCQQLKIEGNEIQDDLPASPAYKIGQRNEELDTKNLAASIGEGLAGETICLVRLPLGWMGDSWHFRHPLDYLGYDGGAGIGSGPGMLIGAALALRDIKRLPVAVLGDGDYMMGVSAFWTAARYQIPFLAIIANNRSFYNDEIHQEKVAEERQRPPENKWIGQHIGGPDIDLTAIAKAQGLTTLGPVKTVGELAEVVREAVALVKAGKTVVIDAQINPGYDKSMSSGMTRKAGDTA